MTERRRSPWVWVLLGIVAVVGIAFAVPPTRVRLLGLLQGEPFYSGLPASGWAEALAAGDEEARAQLEKGAGAAVPVLMRSAFGEDTPAREPARKVLVAIGTPAVPTLLLHFKQGPPADREDTIALLGKMGSAARPAVVPLAGLIGDDTLSGPVLRALASMGPVAVDALPELRSALKSKDAARRRMAALVLVQVGPEGKDALPELIARLGNEEDASTSTAMMQAIAKVGPAAIDPLRSELKGKGGAGKRGAVVETLGLMGSAAAEAVPEIAACLDDASPALVGQACRVLGDLGEVSASAVPQLVAVLKRNQGPGAEGPPIARIRTEAARALGKIGSRAREAVPALTATVGDADSALAEAAATALVHLGPEAASAAAVLIARFPKTPLEKLGPGAVPHLLPFLVAAKGKDAGRDQAAAFCKQHPEEVLKGLQAQDPATRRIAAELLTGDSAAKSSLVVPALMVALRDEDESVRRVAEATLATHGESLIPHLETELAGKKKSPLAAALRLTRKVADGRRLLPGLLVCLREKDEEVRTSAVRSLMHHKVYPREALATLAKAAREGSMEEHAGHLLDIARYGREVRKILAELLPLAEDPSPEVRTALGRCLDAAGPPPTGLDALLKLAGDKEPQVRGSAYRAMGGASFARDKVLPILRKGLQEGDPMLREAAIAGLEGLGKDARGALPELLKVAEEKGGPARSSLRAIAAIGPKEAMVRESLVGLLQSTAAPEIRAGCIEALGRMGPAGVEALPVLGKFAKEFEEEVGLARFRIAPSAEGLEMWLQRLKEKSPGPATIRFFEEHPRDRAVPDLLRLAEAEDAKTRVAALQALSKVKDGRLHKLVPKWTRDLTHADPDIRAATALLLGSLGENAQGATDRLIALYEEPYSPRVRQAAGLALLQIDPEAAELAGVLK